ncbi:hypothetical protein CYG49_01715 [Candidatus Saccharibacteria bacterium]|nr:MAG: hypothetical protein CYG49_01715 [Candidatus Saccharibacteria bacterium]
MYNFLSLLPFITALSFNDRNVRRIILLTIVLPVLAVIVGQLKERVDFLLEHEKEARRKAEESEERLRFMAESMPQKIFTTTPRGRLDYFNPQWMDYTGLTYRQTKSNKWPELIHPDDVTENIAKWEHSLKTGEPFSFEHRFKRHDGQYRWHLTRARAMHDENGRIKIWVGSSTDIDDIKSALKREHKLEKTTARLTEQREELLELNHAKDEFISLASHQLRTPATGVKQYVGMVLEGYAGNITSDQKAYLTSAYESNERQITIINDLLKVAKVDAGKISLHKEKIDISDLIKDIIQEQSSRFKDRQQTILFTPKQSKILATVDIANIRMVLENIIDNASKYTPSGKTIEVTAKKSRSKLIIAVRDEGVGIDQKNIGKIFQKFSRIDNPLSVEVGGSGLGLYWAKKIIDHHNGTIEIQSEINKGSTFTITLPS